MVSLINFGNISKINGRTVTSGSQSGLDTAGIIEALATAKRLPAVKFEDNIKINNNKISALTELKTKLTALKDAVGKLRTPVGFQSTTTNAFEARTAFLSMTSGDTAANYVGVTTANGAPIGKYELEVTNLAVAQSNLSESFTSLTDSVVMGDASGGGGTGKFNAGTFTIGYNDANGDPQTQSVTLNAGANLATVRDSINSKSTLTGVKATIIKFAEGDYRLKLYSDKTGLDNAFTFTANTGTSVNFTTTPADDARIKFDNEIITRSSNVIDDLLSDVTFTLYQKTSGAKVNLDIDKNDQGVAEGIAGFLESYNDIRTFAAKQSEVDENGKLKETAYLKNNTVLQTALNKLNTIVSGSNGAGLLSPDQLSAISGTSTTSVPKSLSDLGIFFVDQDAVPGDDGTPAVENLLSIDATKLTNQLQKHFAETRELFEFTYTSDNSDVSSYKRSNAVYDNGIGGFTIEMNHSTKVANITNLVNKDGNPMVPSTVSLTYSDSSGTVVLKGSKGTVMEGMEFFYTGVQSGTSTANVTVKQGVGDVMFNSLESYVDKISGQLSIIDQEIESLKSQNEDAQESVTRIDTMVTSYREQMLNKFSALEALISASNQTLMLLDSQANAQNNG